MTHKSVKGSKRHALPGASPIGRANANSWMSVTMKIRRKTPLVIEERPKEILNYTAFVEKYGAAQEDADKVIEVFSQYGLKALSTNLATRSIKFAGTVDDIERAFQVKLIRYKYERGNFRGRAGKVHVPEAIWEIVEGVFGLDNRQIVKPRASFAGSLKPASAVPRQWFFPEELASIYHFPAGDGTDQCIGLLQFGGGYFESDLVDFCSQASVAVPTVIPISVDGTPTNGKDGYEQEVMLDIEVVAGACPKATIVVYFGAMTEQGWLEVLDAAIHDQAHRPKVLSISWGFAEDTHIWTDQAMTHINESLKDAVAQHITVCVASGDDGSDCQVADGYAHVDFPASSPYVLSVGGTTLFKQAGAMVETAWREGDGLTADGGGSSGGGVSAFFARPAWQTVDVKPVNPGGILGRSVPDVAAEADFTVSGYLLVVNGNSFQYGGTSAAAPLWATLITRINAALPDGKQLGYVTPVLYDTTVRSAGFTDITSGDNITAAVGGFTATAGYDAVTGLGSPIGSKLREALLPLL